ncbi:probable U3 small nucleolar RNA-associated protein 11 [Primulina eburnea]|uniref:probable U3 small nucleolar RNA-associated protein 11 n=1 Tax=Primulina eburnea TaxID=1245227 RepID=UPI003C6C5CF2
MDRQGKRPYQAPPHHQQQQQQRPQFKRSFQGPPGKKPYPGPPKGKEHNFIESNGWLSVRRAQIPFLLMSFALGNHFNASLVQKRGKKRKLREDEMVSFLKNVIPRKAQKERAQPHLRRKFEPLEKHKDYVIRSRAYHQKEQTLLKLKEKATLRNPDEFYFKMIKTKTVGGVHKPESQANKYTNEELMLMKTQVIGYILQKLQTEKKKIERLNGMLHSLDNQSSSKHVYYADNREEAREVHKNVSEQGNPSAFKDLPNVILRKTESSYRELEARKKRLKDLEKIYTDMSMQKELQKRGKKRKLREDEMVSPTSRPVYKWRQERKR